MGESADHTGILLRIMDAPQAPQPYEQYSRGTFTVPGAIGSAICGAGNAIPVRIKLLFMRWNRKDGWRQGGACAGSKTSLPFR